MNVVISAADLLAQADEPGLVLVDTRLESDWRAGTVPGAISVNVYDYFIAESSEDGIRAMAAAARRAFVAARLDRAQRVVFFEQATGMRSPRGLWFHELLGLCSGQILDGGVDAWLAAGGELQPGQGEAFAVEAVEGAGEADDAHPLLFRRDLAASVDEVLTARSRGADIFDVRRLSEFEGTFLHDCCARPGRIPNARHAFYEEFLSEGHFRTVEEISEIARSAGLSPEREIITYCHRGARASTAQYALRLAGFDKVKVFVGSWHEWAGNVKLPVVLGAAGNEEVRPG